jgi:hypothetical protein
MLRLTLSRGPAWLDLGHGVRLLVEPLTTAVMLAARSDPAIVAAAVTSESSSSNDYLTRIVAKAVARLVVQDWEGVGDEDGNPSPMTPEASTRFLNSGRSSRYSRPTTSLGRSSWMRKKTPDRPRRVGVRRGRRVLRGLRGALFRLPAHAPCPPDSRGWQVWDLVQRLGGQVRVAGGMSGGAVLGWDMGAALQLGAALGLSPLNLAELLPPIEAVMVRKINEHLQAGSGLS